MNIFLLQVLKKYMKAGLRPIRKSGLAAVLLTMVTVSSAADASQALEHTGEDVILQWNRVLAETVGIAGQQPSTIVVARSFAMMHGAMFDAVNSINRTYKPYLIDVRGTKHASVEAAAAQAAHDVLVVLYPSRASVFAEELQTSIAGLEEYRVAQGIRVGKATAAAMLTDRANDGWAATPPSYVLSLLPGNWQPTPTAFAAAAFTHYPNVKPFVLTSGMQFLPTPPPALTSTEYATALNAVKAIGSIGSLSRTADQTQSALAWASVGTPTGVAVFWNRVARSLAVSRGTTTMENARLFAMMNMSHHDAFQTSFASKFHYGLWRPVTAIRRADEDANADTEADSTWSSLINNPPYPTYAGNMAAIGMANAGVLALVLGRDDLGVEYAFPSGATRRWASLSAVADDAAKSREYGGIHFTFDSVAGQSIGLNTSNYIFTNFMNPR